MEIMKIELADFGNLFRSDPAKLSDQELLSLDFILHRAWKVKREGGRVHFGEKSWSYEDLINLHAFVRQEMSKRVFQHTTADELDDQTFQFLKENGEGLEEIELQGNPYHDERGRFASGPGAGGRGAGASRSGDGGGSSGGVTPAAQTRIEEEIKAAKKLKLWDVDERYEVGSRKELYDEHEKFTTRWREWVREDDALAGKVLAGTATPKELERLKRRIGKDAEDYIFDRYAMTQKLLQEREIEEVMLYRGLRGQQAAAIKQATKKGKDVEISTRALTSFTTQEGYAELYAEEKGVVIKVKVPARQIFASHVVEHGFSDAENDEVILWNYTGKIKIRKEDVHIVKDITDTEESIFIDDDENANWLRILARGRKKQMEMEDLAPVYPSGIELGREITLQEVLPQIKSFYAHPIFAWIVGGLANWGKTKGDIDILWWATVELPTYFKKILEFRFGRQFKDPEIANRIQHHLNVFQGGPFTKAVPIYALKIERINLEGEIKVAGEDVKLEECPFKTEVIDLVWNEDRKGWTIPESWLEAKNDLLGNLSQIAIPPEIDPEPDTTKQLRSATEEIQAQAEISTKEDEVKLFRFFYPLKPTRGHKPDEPQTIENFLKAFKEEDFPVYSSKKYDGADIIAFRDDDKIQIFSEDGSDNTNRFPQIVEALIELPVQRFAILAEIERWEDDKHLPRETVAAYMRSVDPADDSDFIANIYDIVFFESETAKPGDIHKLPFVDRLKFLDALNIPQSTDGPPDLELKLNLVPHYRANNKEELREQTERLRRLEGSEGNVAKAHHFVYNLENKPSGMVKFHNAAILRGIVTEVKETKTPKVFNFFYGLDFEDEKVPPETIRSVKGKPYHEIGTTFSSALKADVGNVIEVEFETLNVTEDIKNDTVEVTAWAPRVLSVTKDARPMTIGEAIKNARVNFVLQEKEITEDGEILYKGVRQAFGSYGGKRFLAHRITSYITHHKTYVEPFAGGAAVFFAKDPSPKEILNDSDPEIAFMYRFIRDHTPEERKHLEKKDWVCSRETWDRVKAMKPSNPMERFYKCFYLTRASYGKLRQSYNPEIEGRHIDFPATIEHAQKRLRNVSIHNKDYLEILKEYDDSETFFYMDPPYPDKFNLKDFGFKEEEFLKAIRQLKAKWIVSYSAEKADQFKGFHVYRVKRRNLMPREKEMEHVTELLVSNFPLKPVHLYIDKELAPSPEGMETESPLFLPHLDLSTDLSSESDESVDLDNELEKVQAAFKSPGGKYRLYKKIIALIPEHKTFVEVFCGGAQVFFHKKRSELEIMNDINTDLMFAYRFIKSMTPEDWEWLKKQYWVISRSRARKMFEMKPRTPRERFYRFVYLNKATYWGRTDVWDGMRRGEKGTGETTNGPGYHIKLVHRLPEIQERLKGVRLHSWDWKEIIKEYDSKDTFFYLDPPYKSHWPREGGGHGSKFFKEEELVPVLRNIRGKFILSYEMEKLNHFNGFRVYRVKTLWTGMHQLGVRRKYELLVSNFPLKPTDLYIEKSVEPILKQDEIYNINPSEEESYRYVIQSHWRGKSVSDLSPVIISRNSQIEVVPINSLFPREFEGNEFPLEGVEVWGKCGWEKIKRIYRHQQNGCRMLRINSYEGSIDITEEHSLFQGGHSVSGRELKSGDSIDLVEALPPLPETADISLDYAWVMGFFAAQGSYSQNGNGQNVKINFTHGRQEEIKLVAKFARDYGLCSHRWQEGHAYRIGVSGLNVFKKFYLPGPHECQTSKARLKIVPGFVFCWSRQAKEAFLKGYLAGDGARNLKAGIEFATASQSLAQGILLLAHNVWPHLSPTISLQENLFRIRLVDLNHNRSYLERGQIKKILEALNTIPRPGELNPNFKDGNYVKPLVEKQHWIYSAKRYVYDLETETHSFVSGIGKILAHNSSHADFRVESVNREFLIGWTISHLVEDKVTEPVETLEEAKKISRFGDAFKIDFKTGKFKLRKTRAGNLVPAELRAFPKAREPWVWLEVEGVTPPFPAPGATRQFKGVFLIEDEGVAEYGKQSNDVHEYFLHGKLKGRLVIRRLARESLQEASENDEKSKILPPGKIEEAPITTTTLWVAIQPIDQTPIVLTEREVEKKWIPPFGISALPKTVRKLIPDKFQYWKIEDRDDALKVRDNLVTAIKDGEIQIDFNKLILGESIEKQVQVKVPFVLQYQFFRGPIVIRHGPSTEFWNVRIATSPNRVLNFQLTSDPLKSQSVSATLEIERTDKYLKVEGDVPPGSLLNPTKDTPSSIVILDKGEVIVLIDNDTFKKFEFRGEKLKGLWVAQRPNSKASLWEFAQSEQVSVTKEYQGVRV